MSDVPKLWWMKLNTQDYVLRTMQWPIAARALYVDLCALQWNDGSLPAGPTELRLICRFSPREFAQAWLRVETHFPLDPDGRRRNPELAAEYLRAVQVSQNKNRQRRSNVIPLAVDHSTGKAQT